MKFQLLALHVGLLLLHQRHRSASAARPVRRTVLQTGEGVNLIPYDDAAAEGGEETDAAAASTEVEKGKVLARGYVEGINREGGPPDDSPAEGGGEAVDVDEHPSSFGHYDLDINNVAADAKQKEDMEDHLEEVFAMRYSPGGTGGEVVDVDHQPSSGHYGLDIDAVVVDAKKDKEREKGKETGGGHYDLDLANVAVDAKHIVDHLEEAVATRYVDYGEDGVEGDRKKRRSKSSSASTTPAVSQSTPKSESASSKSSSQSSSTSKTCGGIHDACCFGKDTNNKRCQPGLGCHYGLDHNGVPTDPPLEHPTCQLDCGKDKAPCCQSLCSHDDCKCECGNGTVHNIVTKLCEKCGTKEGDLCCENGCLNGLTCEHATGKCVKCGNNGESACDGTGCNDGTVLQAGRVCRTYGKADASELSFGRPVL